MAKAVVLMLTATLFAVGADWLQPFDGRTLNGWKATGNADWQVHDGAIVGRQGPDGAAGDLFTEVEFADFELEAEWRMTWPGNSGVWFRWAGPRTGCQVDFLDNEKAWPGVYSGSVYCMGRQFIAFNRDASVVRKDGWNKLRLHVSGDEVKVWLNGREVASGKNGPQHTVGSIGLQVHAGKQFEGMEVRLRKLRVRPLSGGIQ